MTTPDPGQWQRLSPRMLLVHPVHEVLRQLPLLVGAVVLGSTTENPRWLLLGVVAIMSLGVARWFTTSYRIGAEDVELRTGLLQRKTLSVPRNRIRSVQTDSRLLHRLLGLTLLRVSTGQQAQRDNVFELDAVPAAQVPRLRAVLLAETTGDTTADPIGDEPVVLARWAPSWLRYSPLSWSGLLTISAALGLAYQAGFGAALEDSDAVRSGVQTLERVGPVAAAAALILAVLIVAVILAVLHSLLTYGNLLLERAGQTLQLRHGLLRLREHSYDMSRLRGATLREPLLVRAVGGARLDAVMTGVNGAGESSLLLPPCPAGTAQEVLAGLVGEHAVVTGPLTRHGPMAARRRWFRALAAPGLLGAALLILQFTAGPPGWVWPAWAGLTGAGALLAVDRVRALGHRVDRNWLVARSGSIERRRDCLQTAGIIGWTVRQSFFQRRAGVATLVAATAAGTKRYPVLDVPAETAWAIAATASPWVAESVWAN